MELKEQRARDDAIVLAALPGMLDEIAFRCCPDMAWTGIPNALRRLKRAGKARFNGKVWEAVKCQDQ